MTKEELAKLTPEEKRILIAEKIGFEVTGDKHGVPFGWRNHIIEDVPDYLNDLNAIAAAEAALSSGQHYTFRCRLWDITDASTDRSFVGVNGEEHNRRYCSATAAQRADAFLLAI